MNEQNRATLTFALWFLSAIVLGVLLISTAILGAFTTPHLIIVTAILGLAVIGTGFLWSRKDAGTEQIKAKRRDINDLLGELSSEQLIELKRRLADDDSTGETLLDYIGDDGELLSRH